jgi:hypothetical protein
MKMTSSNRSPAQRRSVTHHFKHAVATLLLSVTSARAGVLFVRPSGNDASAGMSWVLAKRSITNAMATAATGDQIWVAAGTYFERVTVKDGVALYGGFAGTEATLDQRDFTKNLSVLNGRTNGVVVSMMAVGPTTRVDGMVITGGSGIFGGGISSVNSAPVLANNSVIGNTVNAGVGGGIFISGSFAVSTTQAFHPVVTNNLVYANKAFGDGAGIAVDCSSPVIAWNRVIFNLAARNCGGIGMWRASRAIVANNVIEANAASAFSGTIGYGGGILATANDLNDRPCGTCGDCVSAPTIVNNLIAANAAEDGGGIFLADAKLQNPTGAAVVNNTIIANTGSGILWGNTSPAIYNNLVAFNSAGLQRSDTSAVTLQNNDVFGNTVLSQNYDYAGLPNATGQNGNISSDPLLANYLIGDFRLQSNSPCVNAGLTAFVTPGWPDIGGTSRVVGAAVDIGAYESTGITYNVPNPVIRVSPAGNDANDGLSWATAKRTVQAGINAVNASLVKGGEVWVAQGTYTNHISVPAFVYVYGGFTGTEVNRDARNFSANRTILDGGGKPTVVFFESAGYLVSALDGFTVQDGGAYTGGQLPSLAAGVRGGGINCTVSGPIIANNVIQFNSIGTPFDSSENSLGGGIYCYVAHAQIIGNIIANNEVLDVTTGSGGGIYCVRSKPTISTNLFFQNHANYGSALCGTVASVRFVANTVLTNFMYVSAGGQPYSGANDGAVYLIACTNFLIQGNTIQGNWASFGGGIDLKGSEPGQVYNNLLIGNAAFNTFAMIGWGGGIFCQIGGPTIPSSLVIMNNTIVGNSAPGPFGSDQGGGISLNLGTNKLTLANNLIAFNSGGIYRNGNLPPSIFSNNCVTNLVNYVNLSPGVGDINVDPRLVNRAAGDYHLLASSPCIDAGTPLNAAPTDKDGVSRPLDGNNDNVAAFDIGAFEFVHPSADTDHDGFSDQAEVIAGTNPINPASFLRLQSSTAAGTNVILSWLSVAGRSYTVQFKSTLESSPWQILTNNVAGTGPIGAGSPVQVIDPLNPAGNRFYRLAVTKN